MSESNKDTVRRLLERDHPQLFGLLTAARDRFPTSKLTGLALRNSAGQMEAIGALHNPEKPDGR